MKGKDGCSGEKTANTLLHVPKDLEEDTMFPYKGADSVFAKVSFTTGENKLMIEEWSETALSRS